MKIWNCINVDITKEQDFQNAIQKLVNEGLVTINIVSGKVVYSAVEPLTVDSNIVLVDDSSQLTCKTCPINKS